MNGHLQVREGVELIRSQPAGFGGALTPAKAAAQGQASFGVAKFSQEFFDFGGELARFANAFERGFSSDLSGLDTEELSALEFTAAGGAFGVDGAGAGAMIECRAGLVNTGATCEEWRFVALLRSDIGEEDAVAAEATLKAERVCERSHFNSMTTGQ